MSNKKGLNIKDKGTATAVDTNDNKSFSDKESTILNQEGRIRFRELMKSLQLAHLDILKKVVDVQSDEIIKRLLM